MAKHWRILFYFFACLCVTHNTGIVRQGSDPALIDFIEIYVMIWQYLVSQINLLIKGFLIMINLLTL